MPGEFSKTNRPKRPGGYMNWDAIQSTPPAPGLGGIVCVAFTGDWGPVKSPRLVRSIGEFKSVFGDSQDTQGYRAVRQAFQGEGLPGFGGAGAVLAYRMMGSAGAKSAHVFMNTAGSPVAAITVTAKYEGSRGNDLNITIQDQAGVQSPEQDELIIYDGSTEVERFTYTDIDIVALAAAINASSNFVTATETATGVGLGYVANVPLTAGADGTTLVIGDFTQLMSDLESQRFSVLTFEAPTDSPTLTALAAWVALRRADGQRFRCVIGGALNEDASTAIARSVVLASEGFINVGVGSVRDEVLGVLSMAMLAPRVAGATAARGESASLTFARFQGLSLIVGPNATDILRCFDGGVVVLSQDSNVDAPVRIEKGLTAFVTKTNADKPYLVYRNPKFVATMDLIDMELSEWAEQNVVGKMPVDNATLGFVRSQISKRMQAREDAAIIQPGWTVLVDDDPPPTPTDEFIQYVLHFFFGRSTEQVFLTGQVG